jgi:hypothetical protein
MARMSCPECCARISPRAGTCPACGCRDPLSLLCRQVARGTQKRDPMPDTWMITAGAFAGVAVGITLAFVAGFVLAWPARPPVLDFIANLFLWSAVPLGAVSGAGLGYHLARRSTRPHD